MSEFIQLDNIGTILSNIGNKIIQNQNILKCLNYNTSNALSQQNIIIEDIIKLSGKGTDPISEQRIFKMLTSNIIVDTVRTELRFGIAKINPDNIYLTSLPITFQIITHYSLWELDDNKQRPFIMINEILKVLNGNSTDIGGIGQLQLISPIIFITFTNNNFSGYTFSLSTTL